MLKIFKISTAALTINTANIIYSINCKCWNKLPCEGFILLQVNQSAPAASDALPVLISTTNKVNTDTTTTFASDLVNGAGDLVTSAEITQGNRYLIYFNKSDGTFQMVNYIPAA